MTAPETVKLALLTVREPKEQFTVAFSGVSHKRVNGYYVPCSREIVINDRNFRSDNLLFFTALHEYAHHVSMSELGLRSCKAHSPVFWSTFHDLLEVAESLGLYVNPSKDDVFSGITADLKTLLVEAARVTRETGKALVSAQEFCLKNDARFDDYVLRELKQSMPWAKTCMSAHLKNVPAEVGPENLKLLSSIKNPYTRRRLTKGVQESMSPMQAKVAAIGKPSLVSLDKSRRDEEERIRREIMELQSRLAQIQGGS